MSRRAVSSLLLVSGLALPFAMLHACSSDSSNSRDDQTLDSDAGTDARADTEDELDAGRDSAVQEPVVDKITNAGATCSDDTECTGEGGDENRCLDSVIGVAFPGGYCTTACIADSECGANARCPLAPLFALGDLSVLGEFATQARMLSTCLKTCDTVDDCRADDGYTCASADEIISAADALGVDLSVRYCIPPVNTGRPDAGQPPLDGGVDAGDGDAAVDTDAALDAGDSDAGDSDAGTGDAGDSDAAVGT